MCHFCSKCRKGLTWFKCRQQVNKRLPFQHESGEGEKDLSLSCIAKYRGSGGSGGPRPRGPFKMCLSPFPFHLHLETVGSAQHAPVRQEVASSHPYMCACESRHLLQKSSLFAAESSSFVRPKGNYGRRISFFSRGGGGTAAARGRRL